MVYRQARTPRHGHLVPSLRTAPMSRPCWPPLDPAARNIWRTSHPHRITLGILLLPACVCTAQSLEGRRMRLWRHRSIARRLAKTTSLQRRLHQPCSGVVQTVVPSSSTITLGPAELPPVPPSSRLPHPPPSQRIGPLLTEPQVS